MFQQAPLTHARAARASLGVLNEALLRLFPCHRSSQSSRLGEAEGDHSLSRRLKGTNARRRRLQPSPNREEEHSTPERVSKLKIHAETVSVFGSFEKPKLRYAAYKHEPCTPEDDERLGPGIVLL